MSQLDMFPGYLDDYSGGIHDGVWGDSVQQLATARGRVTLNATYNPLPKPGCVVMREWVDLATELRGDGYGRGTPFDEIVAFAKDVPSDMEPLLGKGPGTQRGSLEETAKLGLDALRAAIREAWVEDENYLMPHSSGYDSRLISLLVGEMNTGNVRFLTWQPEVETTRELLRVIGWDESHIITVGKGEVDYQAPALDFLTLGAYQSEAERFIVGPSLAELQLGSGYANWSTITASFADETLAFATARWPSVAYFYAARLLDNPAPWPSKRWIMPFVSRQWLEFLTTHQIPCSSDDFKREMLRQIHPRFADHPNQRYELAKWISANGHHRYAVLSPDVRRRLGNAYRGSWYVKDGPGEPFDIPHAFGTHAPLVREYIKAAICEYLIGEGVEVTC